MNEQSSLSRAKEFSKLVALNLLVTFRRTAELMKDAFHYYNNFAFFKIDSFLLISYLFHNPFKISKKYLLEKGESDVDVYGETPLTTLDRIAKECGITSLDVVYELGCGRGRGCFWLQAFKKCHVVGIEQVPEFVKRANQIKKKFDVDLVEFRNEDMLKSDFKKVTVIYLYGTCLEDAFIKKLIENFSRLPSGTKIITVSYSLNEYTNKPLFEVMKRFSAQFTWGSTDVYLHLKR